MLKGIIRALSTLNKVAEEDISITDLMSALDEKLAEHTPEAVRILSRILDEMTEEILQDALVSGVTNRPNAQDKETALATLYAIPAFEWQELRDQVVDFNDIAGMFQSEKNSAVGMIFAGIMPTGGATPSDPTGGSSGSTSSSETVGVGQTSGYVQLAKSSSTSSPVSEVSHETDSGN